MDRGGLNLESPQPESKRHRGSTPAGLTDNEARLTARVMELERLLSEEMATSARLRSELAQQKAGSGS